MSESRVPGGKRSSRLVLPKEAGRAECIVPFGIIDGAEAGPAAAVVAGAHGTELASQDAVQALWRQLTPADVRGRLTFVFVANVVAAATGTPTVSPADGKNFNRVWPGAAEGSASERIAHQIWSQLLADSEVVLDLHGGEWNEDLHAFGILHSSGDAALDSRALLIATSSGLPYLEVTEAAGQWLGQGTLSAQTARDHRVGITMEIGGAGRRDRAEIELAQQCMRRALEAAGVLRSGSAAGGPTVVLEGSDAIRTNRDGVLVPLAVVGQDVVAEQELCRVTDFDGELLESVRAPRDGRLLLRSVARVVSAGALVAKVGWIPQ